MSVSLNVRLSKIMCTPIKLGVCTYATYANRQTLTGFLALQLILRLLPTLTFPPMANLFNSLAHFIQSIYSACFFNLFFQPVFRPLFQSCGLVFSHVFTNFYAYSPLTGFPAIYLSNFSLSSFIDVPSPESFSQCWAYFFSQFFGHLVSLPQMSLPKSSSRLANSCCTIGSTSKRVA